MKFEEKTFQTKLLSRSSHKVYCLLSSPVPAALILKLNLKYFFFVQILTQQMAKLQDTLNEANQVCAFIPMRSPFYYMYFSLLTEYYLL